MAYRLKGLLITVSVVQAAEDAGGVVKYIGMSYDSAKAGDNEKHWQA
jgi:hypothetical protein